MTSGFRSIYSVPYWTPLLVTLAPTLPVRKLSAWLREESGGYPGALGTPFEVGIFQIDLQDGPRYGATTFSLHESFCMAPDSEEMFRALTADEDRHQVITGIAMIEDVLARTTAMLTNAGIAWSDDDLWCLIKLWHCLPRLWDQYLHYARNTRHTESWAQFRAFITGLTRDGAANVNAEVAAKYWPFNRFFNNAERVGYAG